MMFFDIGPFIPRNMLTASPEDGREMIGWWAYTTERLVTSERVMPAAGERSGDVEQQAQEDNVQLPKEIER